MRKYRNKLVIKPGKEGLKALVQKTRECIKGCVGQTAQTLINKLNPMIGAGPTIIATLLGGSLLDRGTYHPRPTVPLGEANPPEQVSARLAEAQGLQREGSVWVCYPDTAPAVGENAALRLYSIARTVLEWHIKVRGEANPYDPAYTEYFERRRCFAWRTLPRENTGELVLAGI